VAEERLPVRLEPDAKILVVVVSADYRSDYKLPKLVSLKQFIEAGAIVYVTGDGLAPQRAFCAVERVGGQRVHAAGRDGVQPGR
jgi:hypothetical protein